MTLDTIPLPAIIRVRRTRECQGCDGTDPCPQCQYLLFVRSQDSNQWFSVSTGRDDEGRPVLLVPALGEGGEDLTTRGAHVHHETYHGTSAAFEQSVDALLVTYHVGGRDTFTGHLNSKIRL